MKRVWSEESRLARLLEVELAALDGLGVVGAQLLGDGRRRGLAAAHGGDRLLERREAQEVLQLADEHVAGDGGAGGPAAARIAPRAPCDMPTIATRCRFSRRSNDSMSRVSAASDGDPVDSPKPRRS